MRGHNITQGDIIESKLHSKRTYCSLGHLQYKAGGKRSKGDINALNKRREFQEVNTGIQHGIGPYSVLLGLILNIHPCRQGHSLQ